MQSLRRVVRYNVSCSICRGQSMALARAIRDVTAPIEPEAVYRPMQYLGSKVRSLEAITRVVEAMAPNSVVADPFSGTSVVSQALAANGHRVLASDAMQFAATFGVALLGVGRTPVDFEAILASMPPADEQPWFEAWGPWVDRERQALGALDGPGLIELSLDLPQVWRPTTGGPVARQLASMAQAGGRNALEVGPLAATHYAGTYFGLLQALEIDAVRQEIERMKRRREIGSWPEAVLLTALLAAASAAAFSAGKHYAQPHAIHRAKDLGFAAGRIVQDRRKDIGSMFRAEVRRLVAVARPAHEHHEVAWAPVESPGIRRWLGRSTVVYADPPYTAQQYSRFYHVPEVLTSYLVPTLQVVDGAPTRGLYPDGRFKSRFSSKRATPQAFEDLCGAVSAAGSSLVLSYSASVSGSTGNDRMIGLEDLLSICRTHFHGRVEVKALDHEYRQFNGGGLAVSNRADPEYLIACHADSG